MAESTQGQVVHKREPNWALLVPIFYAPLFPLMRIALKGNPRLPQYYAIGPVSYTHLTLPTILRV